MPCPTRNESARLCGSQKPMSVPSGARTYATSRPHGIRLGAAIGVAPSATAFAKEAGTSRVRKAISIPAGRPSAGRTYRFSSNISPSEWAAMANGTHLSPIRRIPEFRRESEAPVQTPVDRNPPQVRPRRRTELSLRTALSYDTSPRRLAFNSSANPVSIRVQSQPNRAEPCYFAAF